MVLFRSLNQFWRCELYAINRRQSNLGYRRFKLKLEALLISVTILVWVFKADRIATFGGLHTGVLRHLSCLKHVALKPTCVIKWELKRCMRQRCDTTSLLQTHDAQDWYVFGETCLIEVALAHAHNTVLVSLLYTNNCQGVIAVCAAFRYQIIRKHSFLGRICDIGFY